MKRKVLLVAGVLGLTYSSFALPGTEIDISVGAVQQKPSGQIQYPVPTGDVIDLKKDLGLGDKTKPFIRAKIEHPIFLIPNLYLQYMPMEFSGTGNITRDITYNGKTYEAETKVDSKIKLDRFDIGLYGNLPFVKKATNGILDPELGIDVRIINFKGSITGTEKTTGQTETASKSATVPIPLIYAGLGVNVPNSPIPVSLVGELRGISYSKAKYYDYSLELKVTPVKPVYVSAGYRYEKLKIDTISNLYTNITVKGAFFTVGAKF
ncbi:MAG: TIGR04219 family outer membrane beta-barrel protein [Hydrogenothermaceae bacterium]